MNNRFGSYLLTLAVLLAGASHAWAQVAKPYVPPETFQERRWIRGSEITFCIWSISPTIEIDRRIGQEIGNALLLDVKFYEFTNTLASREDDFWEAVLVQLGERCDAIMGFTLGQQISADWLIPTRAYYDAPYVLAVSKPEYKKLGDIPAGRPIGSMMFSPVDHAFMEYVALLPKEQRWVRFPMPSYAPIVDYVKDGRVDGALIWAPLLYRQADGDPAGQGIHVASLDPIRSDTTPIGMMVREYNVFLRDQLDQAIHSLNEDGIIDEVLAEVGMPGLAGN